MNDISLKDNPYLNTFNLSAANEHANKSVEEQKTKEASSKLTNQAVNLSISFESIKIYINIQSVEFSSTNNKAQNILDNILNGNQEALDFLAGKDAFSSNLKEMGYEGTAIDKLSSEEAKSLLDEGGFFSINETSNRVASFAIDLANNDLEALKESRKGIVQGFEEAEKMWGGELPEISYLTQEKTLSIIDKKIEELS